MCMRYVNAVTTCYSSMNTSNDNILSFNMPVNGVDVKDRDVPQIDKLIVLCQFNFLGTSDPQKKEFSVLENKDKIDIVIRLTKCSKDPSQRLGYDLDSFSLDFNKIYQENQQQTACFDFYDYMRIINVTNLPLPHGTGKYVIKTLIKKSNEPNYTIQSMTNLTIS